MKEDRILNYQDRADRAYVASLILKAIGIWVKRKMSSNGAHWDQDPSEVISRVSSHLVAKVDQFFAENGHVQSETLLCEKVICQVTIERKYIDILRERKRRGERSLNETLGDDSNDELIDVYIDSSTSDFRDGIHEPLDAIDDSSEVETGELNSFRDSSGHVPIKIRYRCAMRVLSKDDLECLCLCDAEGLSQTEVAKRKGLSVGGIGNKFRRIRTKLNAAILKDMVSGNHTDQSLLAETLRCKSDFECKILIWFGVYGLTEKEIAMNLEDCTPSNAATFVHDALKGFTEKLKEVSG